MRDEINELIKIGKKYSKIDVAYIENNIQDIELNFYRSTQSNMCRHNPILHKKFKMGIYSKSDISYILIGTIVGEVYLMKGSHSGYGSVTATHGLIYMLRKEAPLRAKVMRKWAARFGFVNQFFDSVQFHNYCAVY